MFPCRRIRENPVTLNKRPLARDQRHAFVESEYFAGCDQRSAGTPVCRQMVCPRVAYHALRAALAESDIFQVRYSSSITRPLPSCSGRPN